MFENIKKLKKKKTGRRRRQNDKSAFLDQVVRK